MFSHDLAGIWRRKVRVGGTWYAERKDATWARWSWLKADWEPVTGPPEGVRALPPESPGPLRPPAPAHRDSPRDRLLEWAFPAILTSAAVGGLLSAGALLLNGLVGPWLGFELPLGPIWGLVAVVCVTVVLVCFGVEMLILRLIPSDRRRAGSRS